MKNLILVTGFWFAAGQVEAQGLGPLSRSPEAGPMTWDGYYAGLAVTSGDVSLSGRTDREDYGSQGFGLQFGYLRDTGSFVVGGEFAYVSGDVDDVQGFVDVHGFDDVSLDSARLKAIGGYDAGRFLPYAFVGLSNAEITVETGFGEASSNETAVNYGLGGRVALGAEGRVVAGLEYLVEEVDDFDGSGVDVDNSDISLRFDFRY